MRKSIAIIGGGAGGFFAAINCAEKNPDYNITIFEKSSSLLSKVKISGGGRCNVTHACFDNRELVKFYPRGEKQLLGPFSRFNTSNTIDWFASRGVQIKKEEDGRMFPTSNSSQTIIDCFLSEAKRLGVKIRMQCSIEEIRVCNDGFTLKSSTGEELITNAILVTTGSSHAVWKVLRALGHKIVEPVPSLFTLNITDERIKGLEGLAVERAGVSVVSHTKLNAVGPLLITHWGMSGPVILRLSAWGARILAAQNHKFEIEVKWTIHDLHTVKETLKRYKLDHPKKAVSTNPLFGIPKRLWERLTITLDTRASLNFADLSNKQIELLAKELTASRFRITGKSTNKEEFVTSGGVDLADVDFRTMESKKVPNLYFAGEVLDIDAITGGFNFQAAWTTAFIASQTI